MDLTSLMRNQRKVYEKELNIIIPIAYMFLWCGKAVEMNEKQYI